MHDESVVVHELSTEATDSTRDESLVAHGSTPRGLCYKVHDTYMQPSKTTAGHAVSDTPESLGRRLQQDSTHGA